MGVKQGGDMVWCTGFFNLTQIDEYFNKKRVIGTKFAFKTSTFHTDYFGIINYFLKDQSKSGIDHINVDMEQAKVMLEKKIPEEAKFYKEKLDGQISEKIS